MLYNIKCPTSSLINKGQEVKNRTIENTYVTSQEQG